MTEQMTAVAPVPALTAAAPSRRAGAPERPWWKDAVVYQIYPRSFADRDGNGIGDLAGITSRVPYLAALGVDAVWLSPFYPSALADGGYDVDDHREVAPEIGTLEDFDRMVAALHAVGIRVMVDIVPNHTSDRHQWFHAALAGGPDAPERALYHIRPGAGPGGSEPPNDWRSMFGGSAWERIDDVGPDGAAGAGSGDVGRVADGPDGGVEVHDGMTQAGGRRHRRALRGSRLAQGAQQQAQLVERVGGRRDHGRELLPRLRRVGGVGGGPPGAQGGLRHGVGDQVVHLPRDLQAHLLQLLAGSADLPPPGDLGGAQGHSDRQQQDAQEQVEEKTGDVGRGDLCWRRYQGGRDVDQDVHQEKGHRRPRREETAQEEGEGAVGDDHVRRGGLRGDEQDDPAQLVGDESRCRPQRDSSHQDESDQHEGDIGELEHANGCG